MVNLDSEPNFEFFRAVSCNREQKLGKWLMEEMRSTRGCCFFFLNRRNNNIFASSRGGKDEREEEKNC